MHTERKPFSATIHEIRESAERNRLTLRDLIAIVGPKGHPFLALFLTLPFAQPIPLPGISTPFGIAIAIIGIFMALNKPPWLPKKLANLSIDGRHLRKICTWAEAALRKVEHLGIRARGRAIFARPGLRTFVGISICFHALILSLPLPIPASNFFPALVLVLSSFAMLEEDAMVLLAAGIAHVANAAFFTSLFVVSWIGTSWLWG